VNHSSATASKHLDDQGGCARLQYGTEYIRVHGRMNLGDAPDNGPLLIAPYELKLCTRYSTDFLGNRGARNNLYAPSGFFPSINRFEPAFTACWPARFQSRANFAHPFRSGDHAAEYQYRRSRVVDANIAIALEHAGVAVAGGDIDI